MTQFVGVYTSAGISQTGRPVPSPVLAVAWLVWLPVPGPGPLDRDIHGTGCGCGHGLAPGPRSHFHFFLVPKLIWSLFKTDWGLGARPWSLFSTDRGPGPDQTEVDLELILNRQGTGTGPGLPNSSGIIHAPICFHFFNSWNFLKKYCRYLKRTFSFSQELLRKKQRKEKMFLTNKSMVRNLHWQYTAVVVKVAENVINNSSVSMCVGVVKGTRACKDIVECVCERERESVRERERELLCIATS